MKLTAGSFSWLIANDIRLNWRAVTALFRQSSSRVAAVTMAAVAAVLHLVAWPAVNALTPVLADEASSATGLGAVMGAMLCWMIAQSLFTATRTLYDRGDLDLLMGSPLPPTRIIAAKAVAIMVSTVGSIAIFVLPLANMGALLDGPRWLAIYPVLMALALIATSVGLAVAMTLFRIVGPVRARFYAHMTGAVIGGGFILAAQIYAALPVTVTASFTTWLAQIGTGTGVFSSLVALPVHAGFGDLTAQIGLLAAAIALFTTVTTVLGDGFARAAMMTSGAPLHIQWRPTSEQDRPFQSGVWANLRRKEWRLLVRDPSLFVQLSLQIIYTIPIAVALLRSGLMPTAVALVPAIVVIAAQVAGSIAWITVSGEDAPELIASAPVQPGSVDRAKLSAVALPVFVILAIPLACLAWISWPMAVIALTFSCLAGASTALLNFWHPMPGNRRGMLRRHSQSKLVGLVEHAISMLWALAVVLAIAGTAFALVPITMVITTLMVAARRHRSKSGVGRNRGGLTSLASALSWKRNVQVGPRATG